MKPIKLITAAAASDSTKPSPSADEIAGNIDLVTEILLRLPIKSLIKFKSVSKQWLSLISDPKFSHSRSPSTSSPSGLFLQRSFSDDELCFVGLTPNQSRPPFRSITLGDDSSGVKIANSCNGLLLCYKASADTNETTTNYFVYNPTTNHFTTLPPLTNPELIYCITLAFDPSKSPHYKAICVRSSGEIDPTRFDETQFWIEMYSSETRAWQPSSMGFFGTGSGSLFEGGGMLWNGCVHWIGPWWGTSLYFKLEEESVHEMPLPPESETLDNEDRKLCYAASGDHFHLVDLYLGTGEALFYVYELERDYSGWFLKYVVDFSEVSRAFPEMNVFFANNTDAAPLALPDYYAFSVLCVVRCAVEEESFLVMSVPGKVLRYNFLNGTFCKLCDVSIGDGRNPVSDSIALVDSIEAYQYVESLACV